MILHTSKRTVRAVARTVRQRQRLLDHYKLVDGWAYLTETAPKGDTRLVVASACASVRVGEAHMQLDFYREIEAQS